jgi:CBS domain containing-hemolysin-like protein
MIFEILLVLFIVGLNGFFVAAEFAIVKVRRAQLEEKIAQGRVTARITASMLENLDLYLSASQVGITFASLALGWLGEPVVAEFVKRTFELFGVSVDPHFAHQIAVPLGFVVITMLHLVIGELIPKYLAVAYPRPVALGAAIPLRLFAVAVRPLVLFVTWLSKAILRPFGVRIEAEGLNPSEEELRMLLAQSAQSTTIDSIQKSEHELIENVFSFDERTVRQIMVPRSRMSALPLEATPEATLDAFVLEGYSRVPVYSGDREKIVGVIHLRDVLRTIRDGVPLSVEKILRPAYFVPESKKIAELLREFQKEHIHIAIVVDEFGTASGLVTLEDIVEELVGEIQDEYDEEAPIIEPKGDRAYVINAHAPLVDVNKHLPEPLPASDSYSTVAGFVNELFEVIPNVGQTARHSRYEFTVLRRSKRGVDSVLVEFLPDEQKEVDAGLAPGEAA